MEVLGRCREKDRSDARRLEIGGPAVGCRSPAEEDLVQIAYLLYDRFTALDITGPHEVLNSLPDAVIAADVDGRVTYLNPAAESVMGWSRQEASGRPLQDVAISGPARNGANAGSGSRLRRSLSFLTTA